MDTKTINENFIKTSGFWLSELERFTEPELKIKPAEDAWSIGQVYAHLIKSAMFFQFKNIEQCISSDDHKDEPMNERTTGIFKLGAFFPIEVKVPLEFQPTPQQPGSKDEIRAGLKNIINLMSEFPGRIDAASHHGKAQHPALGYLNAIEWYELIDMHFRHHMRQKDKVERFIAAQK